MRRVAQIRKVAFLRSNMSVWQRTLLYAHSRFCSAYRWSDERPTRAWCWAVCVGRVK